MIMAGVGGGQTGGWFASGMGPPWVPRGGLGAHLLGRAPLCGLPRVLRGRKGLPAGPSGASPCDFLSGRPDLNRRPLDPQDMALAVLPGQRAFRSQAPGVVTCGLSGRAQDVWSQSGPKPGRQVGGYDLLGVNSSRDGRWQSRLPRGCGLDVGFLAQFQQVWP